MSKIYACGILVRTAFRCGWLMRLIELEDSVKIAFMEIRLIGLKPGIEVAG
jgi:hypothetical protein